MNISIPFYFESEHLQPILFQTKRFTALVTVSASLSPGSLPKQNTPGDSANKRLSKKQENSRETDQLVCFFPYLDDFSLCVCKFGKI